MMKRVGLASLSLLGSLSLAPSVRAQPTPPAPAPDSAAPVEPSPPAPTAAAPAAAAPTAAPPTPTAPTTSASANAALSTGEGYDISASAAPLDDDNDAERTWRATSLHLGSALSGSTGLVHVVEAGAGAPGTFRLAATGSYFAGSGF